MLPRTVAEDLKQNGSFNAEHFPECTIFQSDMVGFTQLSSNSSPFQVTDMLNTLFSCFDDRISIYDTYKVETVGDGYMVVSGVPRRNGVRHASEIATLSLDLLYHVNKLELPHLSGERYKIRIGCHSGPVVAGVVGTKNPRYCLFGSTVRIVALMESSGETNKIQVSHSTYSLLSAIGGFEMEERQTMSVFAKDELKKNGCSQTTFWLLQKDFQVWEGYSTISDASSFGSFL
ncbi:guanylate cyclase 2G-like [Mytilus californianus]|uniref:guanylate cyclase 2G-like n=1 Tax=Mytilus californianus TaxID=6549 RepID=UPI002247A8EC|nr:guanylate cyclase 2G-like [Mytilus californianus]